MSGHRPRDAGQPRKFSYCTNADISRRMRVNPKNSHTNADTQREAYITRRDTRSSLKS